ncbi:MAG: alpha/beta hydrolase [Caulobacterales bacterium]
MSSKSKTPVVFVHGAFCGGWAWDAFREPFEAAGYETHAPSLPHHERGADLEALAKSGVQDYCDAIVHYAKGMSAPPILIGHSLGGLIVQMAAMHMPVSAVVLMASSAPWGVVPMTLDEAGNALGMFLLGDYWSRAIPPDYRAARMNTLDRLSHEDARRAFARFVPESGRAVRETMQWWSDISMATSAPVYKISAPILGIGGGKDRINSSSTVRRIINRFPAGQGQFKEFPTLSHWMVNEPEYLEVAAFVIDWLDANARDPSPKRRSSFNLFGFGADA